MVSNRRKLIRRKRSRRHPGASACSRRVQSKEDVVRVEAELAETGGMPRELYKRDHKGILGSVASMRQGFLGLSH